MKKGIKILVCMLAAVFSISFFAGADSFTAHANESGEAHAASEMTTEEIVAAMSTEEKISQMVIPAIRTWNGSSVTDLSEVPELAEALRKHQYGGIILYGGNVETTSQLTRLISELQANNADIENVSVNIPYFMPVDQEGGIVTRITSGTRMTGNMAIGATGENASENAALTGKIIGEELAAVGFNADYAPVVDVNNNPANPVIRTRSFSDDPDMVAELGVKYNEGLAESNVVGTFKHFPGHGDTETDSHIGTPSVEKTLEELHALEFVPFKKAIENGADMIMTAHITYPLIDEEQTFADGSKGFYPATMSRRMMTDVLRNELGFNGVIVTDALEMSGISDNLVPGQKGTAEYSANISEKVINAGVDILLLPRDMTSPAEVLFYDEYIAALEEKVNAGTISIDRINESVGRIIDLKKKYGITKTDTGRDGIDEKIAFALDTVGSLDHHNGEMKIAREAITLVKNDNLTVPVSGYDNNIVIIGREKNDNLSFLMPILNLRKDGIVDPNAQIVNLVTGEKYGDDAAEMKMTIGNYLENGGNGLEFAYSDELKAAVSEADTVIMLGMMNGLSNLADTYPQHQGITTVKQDAHDAGAKFIYISANLPYDAARYTDADAVFLAYMGAGLNMDPTEQPDVDNRQAYNANVLAAINAIFDLTAIEGSIPVNVPVIEEDEAGPVYSQELLYERGYGLEYTYAFTEGEGSVFDKDKPEALVFKNNARADFLAGLFVDGESVSTDYSINKGFTTVELPAAYLQTIENGEHKLKAVYDYVNEEHVLEVTFSVTGGETEPTQPDPTETEPTETDSTETDPTETDPTETDPTQTDPTVTDPTQNDKQADNNANEGTDTDGNKNDNARKVKKVVKANSTTGSPEVRKAAAVHTGDTNALVWCVIAVAAAGVIITAVIRRKE